MRVEEVPRGDLELLVEELSGLRHDLGKYVTFGVRFLGPEPCEADLRAALEGDLLRTHRGVDGDESAWALWARLRPVGLSADPDVQRIDAGIAALANADLGGDARSLASIAELARGVAAATRSLHRRAAERLS
ncbi:MAG: hypothetical protein VX265_10175 [Myxococcota bacterium]|nr:hypothetical protein [Myxococcota bacterium]MEC8425236.1 hypothetical protein [Myxococcota bacterium]